MCDCFHLAFPNWHAASSETGGEPTAAGGGRRLRGAEPVPEDNSICDEPSQFTEGERPRPQGSSPVEEYPEMEKYTDSDKECEAEHDPHRKSGGGKKSKKSGLGSMFEKRTTLKATKLKEAHSPESEVIVKTAQDGGAEGLIYGGGGRDGIFIKEVVPESPASKSLKLKEGDQLLSATVYFDNVPYEDAIQILGCAQAYKVKLCLKRKPDIIETESIIDSDVIPEDETFTPEMRERGKTKRRSDARISWPKFHTLGKKSTFTRSHSSSEADEQRKLELSPTTSDTESPIKSQDALKGKKKNKLRLSFLKKRGRVSSSEDLCSDTPTHKQISGKSPQTSDVLSPEGPESPPGETPEVYITEDRKEVGDFRPEQSEQTLTHKMELISIDSTLKTEDLTVALADQKTPSGTKSPDGKKKKKERSEIKIKILGKDKSHKKDAKAKASPKRLKTLGASIETADQQEAEKSSTETHKEQRGDEQALDTKTQPINSESLKVSSELGVSDAKILKKSPKKGEDKTKKGKDKHKQDTKAFKLPKIGFGGITNEEQLQNRSLNVEECTIKPEQSTSDGMDVKEDPYERLSKSSLSKTQLPKREDIEIPGMEDMSRKTTAKGMKEPKVVYTGHYDEVPSEPIPISIDVDSVKEAVSKLPGYKLPKVDTSGVPIPEEITVIDANAQRISVKTPTKVLDTKTKHETQFTQFDISASPSMSKTTDKLPKITPADLTSEVLIMEIKTEKTDKSEEQQGNKEIKTKVYNREDIIIPGKETVAALQTQDDKKSKKTKESARGFGIAMPDINIPNIGFDLPKQNISQKQDDNLQGERTIFLQDVQTTITETKTAKGHIGGVESDVKVPEIEGIEYIDSVAGLSAEKEEGIQLKGLGVNLDTAKTNIDISLPEIKSDVNEQRSGQLKFRSDISDISLNALKTDKVIIFDGAEIKTVEREGHDGKFKMPNLGISMPKVEGPKIDLGLSKKDEDVKLSEAKAEVNLKEAPEVEATLGSIDVSIHGQNIKVDKPELEIKHQQTEHKPGTKIKMPELGIKMPKIKAPQFDLSLSKKDVDVGLSKANAEIKLPETAKTEDSIKEQKMEIKTPNLEIKSLQTEDELDRHGGKIKMPKVGITIPKLEGPEFNLSLSKQDADLTLLEARAEMEPLDVPKISVDMKSPKIEPEMDVQGSKFKKLEMTMPKIKLPETDFHLSRKETDVKLPEVKTEVILPDTELKEPSAKADIEVYKSKSNDKNVDGSSKFKMPSLTMPKFGGATPNVGVEISKKSKAIPIPETQLKPHEEGVTIDITAPSIITEGPSLEVKKTQADIDGKGHKFKMPKLGISVPKVKGPEIDLSLSQREGDLPEAKAEVQLPDFECSEPGFNAELKAPEVTLPQADVKGSALKFKMPKFKLPNFGSDTPNLSAEVSCLDKDRKMERPDINITAEELTVDSAEPNIDLEGPSIEIRTAETKLDEKGMNFKVPHLGLSMPKAKGHTLDFSLSKKEEEVTLSVVEADVKLQKTDLGNVGVSIPETKNQFQDTKVEAKLPETTKINVEMKPPEFETNRTSGKFKVPKFGINLPKVKGPEIDISLSKKDVDMSLSQTKVEVKLPDTPKVDVSLGKAEMKIPEATVEAKQPEVEIKPLRADADLEKHGGKFKLPKFGIKMPKVKGPDIDLNFSRKDADVTLPEASAAIKVPDVDLKIPSTTVEIEPPKIAAQLDQLEGSPSKLILPTFEQPIPNISADVPNKDIHIEGAELKKTNDGMSLDIAAQNADIVGPSLALKIKETEGGVKEGKFKMPKFGISLPKVQGPKIDMSSSKKSADVKLPDAKAELPEAPEVDVKLGKVDISIPEATIEVEKPHLERKSLQLEGEFAGSEESPSKYKLPTFKLPKFGVTMPSATVEVPESRKEHKISEAEIKIPKETPTFKGPSIEVNTKETEYEVKGSKFKLPKLGMTMPKVTGPETDLSLSKKDVDVTLPEADIEMKTEKKDTKGSPSKYKLPTFKLPKFGANLPSAHIELLESDKDLKMEGVDMKIPEKELKVEIETPSTDIVGPSIDIKTTGPEKEEKGGKFKMPKLGVTMPKVSGPEFDLSLSKKDVDVTVPEGKVELEGPSADVDIKAPEIKVQTKDKEGSPSKFKMPAFRLPKFGVTMSSAHIELPESGKDLKMEGVDIKIPEKELKVDVAPPSMDTEGPSIDIKTKGTENEVKGGKFEMPKLGVTMPKVSGPEFDLSLSKKDVDVTVPEGKAEVKLPGVELEGPSADVDIKAPEIKVQTKDKEGSPSKFKMPAFRLPKFGVTMPSAHIELPESDKDLKMEGVDIKIPEKELEVDVAPPSIDIEGTLIDVKTTGTENEVKGGKFKMPKLGVTMPKVSGPEFDLSLSKKDVDVTLPEGKAEVRLPGVELEGLSADVDIKAPEIKVQTKDKEGSPSKYKLPTFKLPKFGVTMPSAHIELPESDKDLKMDVADIKIPEKELEVDVAATSIDIKGPSIDIKTKGTEKDVKGGKFKMPKLGMTMPKVSGPEFDLSLSKKDVDVTLPEGKAEVRLPGVELEGPSADVDIKAPEIKVQTKDKEGSPSKYKLPTFKLPKFGASLPSAHIELPESDKDLKMDVADIKIPEKELEVDVAATSIDIKGPSMDIKTEGTEKDVKGGKFKMPKLGVTMPKVSGPEFDLSLSKKDVDVTLPEGKAEVKLPGVELEGSSADVDIKAPEIKVQTKDKEGSPSKFKMPAFRLPKFGVTMPSAHIELPESDKDIKMEGVDIKIPEKELKVNVAAPSIDIEGPSIDIKTTGPQKEEKGGKFKMPKLGVTMPKVSGQEFDLSLSKKDVDVTVPEGKAEVRLPGVELEGPSADVDIKAPEIKVQTKDKEGSPSKYKLPTFKLPKFGASLPSAHIELPESDKDLKMDVADIKIPEKELEVDVAATSIDIKGPSIDVKTKGTEKDVKGSRFKMPKLGVTMPKVSGPEFDLSLSKKDVDVTLPEGKAEVKLPGVELEGPSAEVDINAPEIKVQTKDKEGSPSKYKLPTFKLPKFGASLPSAHIELPESDKDLKMDGVDIKIPEKELEVDVAPPSIDIKGTLIDVKTTGTEKDVKGGKFKMPKLGMTMPKVSGPEFDLSLSKKDVDVTLPEGKAEVKLPGVELEGPSAEVDINAPEIKVQTKEKEGSPSKYKLPTFKLPKFGASLPSAHIELPESDKDLKMDVADIKIPEKELEVDVAPPSIDIKGPSMVIKTKGTEKDVKGGKFKMPKLGMTMPKVSGPEFDLSLSKKDVDVTLPEGKAEVRLPGVELEGLSADVDIKAPEIKVQTKDKEGSPSKYKLPTFKLPKFGVTMPRAHIELPESDKDLKMDGADIKIPEKELKVDVAATSIDIKGPSIDIKTKGPEKEVKGGKFKMPKLGVTMSKVSGPEFDLSLSKKDVDVTLPEGKAEVKLPGVELEGPSADVDIKAPEIKVQTKDKEGSPSKYKLPTFKLPKFGVTMPRAHIELPESDKDLKMEGVDIKIPEKELKVDVAPPSIDIKGPSIDVKTKGPEKEVKGGKFKMPKLGVTMPKVSGPEFDLSLSKKDVDVTLPEGKAEVKLPGVELEGPSADVDIKAPEIKVLTKEKEGSPSKFKMPNLRLPKFGASLPSTTVEVPDYSKTLNIDGAELKIPEEVLTVDITVPNIGDEGLSIDVKTTGTEKEGKGNKFKMPNLGFSAPQLKGPSIDLSLSKKELDMTLPEAKAEVKLPEVKLKDSSTKVEVVAPGIDVKTSNIEGSPSKFKMPTFRLPKFGAATAQISAEVPEIEKNMKSEKEKLEVSKEGETVDVTGPSTDVEGLSVDVKGKGSGMEGSGSIFKLPNLGISMSKVKGPEIDLSLSKKDVDVTLPEVSAEVKVHNVGVKDLKDASTIPDASTILDSASAEADTKLRQSSWTFPKFSFTSKGAKVPDVDVNLETLEVDVSSEDAKADPCSPGVDVRGPSGTISSEEPPAMEADAHMKKYKFSLPRLSFSKSSTKEPEISAEHLHVDVSLPEGKVIVTQPSTENKVAFETEPEGQGSKFKLPKFGIALPKAKGPQEELDASQKDVDIKLTDVKVQVKLPETEVKSSSSADAKAKDAGGSPLTLKGKSAEVKTDGSKEATTDMETSTETEGVGQGSPSKFKLSSFKMPKLSFSRPKPEDQNVAVESECQENQQETEVKEDSKSPKLSLTSFGEILKTIDVEFDVSKTDKADANFETSKEVHKTVEHSGKQSEVKEKETHSKQDATKSPERTGWFKFPKFGLSSPSEPAKIPEKDKDGKSPEGETVDDTISPTCSVQSSDAFADISSAVTSEHVGLSSSSPTKVTVKYSDPNTATGLEEVQSNIITSTTRTELISVEPYLPEKITILSSGVSSSSEDTLRLESGKIHVITSNIEATPEAQHAKLLTTVKVQSAAGSPLQSESSKTASWTVEDSQSSKKTVYERRLVTQTSGDGSEHKETVVITKQITRMLDPAEHISGETASSIQRLRETVHTEKMKFFDEAEK